MSASTTTQAHIAYELIDDSNPDVVVVEFVTEEIVAPTRRTSYAINWTL